MDEINDPEIANYLQELERLSNEVQEEKKLAKLKKQNINNANNNVTQIGPQIPTKPIVEQVIAKAPVKSISLESPIYPIAPSLDLKKKIGQIPDLSEVPLPSGYTKSNAIQSYAPSVASPIVPPLIPMITPPIRKTQAKETKGMSSSGVSFPQVRKVGEIEWEDPTLGDWDTNDFRIFVGDLGNEVSDETLKQAFLKYPSLLRVRVVHDKKNKKSKGFGFVSLADPNDYLRAMKEMDGVYVGNRPIKLRKSKWKDRVDSDKSKKLEKKKKQRSKTRVTDMLAN